MIRKNALNFKLFLRDYSIVDEYNSFLENFDPERECCPFCGARGDCQAHAYYERTVVEIKGGKPVCSKIRILRVKCSCKHTHAIIPDSLVPYRSFSLQAILYILRGFLQRKMKLDAICEAYDISRPTLYRWRDTFIRHWQLWANVSRASHPDALAFLGGLLEEDPFSGFARAFFQATLLSFLQSHQNPANCRHLPTGWSFG